jgi:uncharacterized RDD family membrane protein YckC
MGRRNGRAWRKGKRGLPSRGRAGQGAGIMSSWYFVKDGQRNGPMGREELDARIADGTVHGDTLVWRVGMSSWVRACPVVELGVPPPLLPPPLPPYEPPAPPAWTAVQAAEAARRTVPALDYAGFWPRLAAKFLDGLVLWGPAALVQAGVVAVWFGGVAPVLPELKELKDLAGAMDFLRMQLYCVPFYWLIAASYSMYFISKYEATPGKRLLGLRVVRADGSRVGAGRAFGRFFAERVSDLTFYAGYVMAAFDDEKRALHDCICDTRVVRGARAEAPARAPDGSGRGVNADGV